VDDVLYVPLIKVRVLRSDALYQLGFYHAQTWIRGWQIGQMPVKENVRVSRPSTQISVRRDGARSTPRGAGRGKQRMVGSAPLGRNQQPAGPSRAARAGLPLVPKPGLRRFLKLGITRLVPMSGHRHTDDGAAYEVAAIAGRPATGKPDVSRPSF